ncbi:hypothetical protein [Hymenobacter sediminicola]|uniref:Uncharacterized protein n=1 Tax=Hymenobacter sediminicola TaxID=2761579 RepID=A0A7G7W4I9_9BACT|nr:hypothetical protein [Hymenobacter sediminicola]QNH61282.1 hypothetical protein H4317_14075 [Hymenobacter sediminicola]
MKKIYFLLSVGFVLLQACQSEAPKETVVEASPQEVQPGPVVSDSLTRQQLEKIDYLVTSFREVDPSSREQWIADFQKDQNPDKEIDILTTVANAYNAYCTGKNLDLETKKEVFGVLIMRSSAPEDVVLQQLPLKHLTPEQAKQVMQAYGLPTTPIRVTEK